MKKRKIIVIIDPVRSASMYRSYFDREDVETVVYISPRLPLNIQAMHQNHVGLTFYSLDQLDNYITLNKNNIINIIAGCESGVELSEVLAEKYGFTSNKTESPNPRRNKFTMQKRLEIHNLRHINSMIINNKTKLNEIFVSKYGYVIKPISSCGSDGVKFVASSAIADELLKLNFTSKNILGELNTEYILQEYIEGDQFAIDFIAMDGIFYLTSFSKHDKLIYQNEFIQTSCDFFEVNDSRYQDIISYAKKVSSALGCTFGPVHIEIKYDGSPVMIEIAARLGGGSGIVELLESCYKPSPMRQAVDTYLGKRIPQDAVLIKNASAIGILNYQKEEIVFSVDKLEQRIKSLNSYITHTMFLQNGVFVASMQCVGVVCLAHENLKILNQDKVKLNELVGYINSK